MPKIRVEIEIRPTEDPAKIERALRNVFEPDKIRIEERSSGYKILVAESYSYRSLLKIHDLIRRERILDAARNILRKGVMGNMIIFKINKQAALQGRLSFVESDSESPLGPITFIVETDNPYEVIDWLAPRTSKGRPLWEREIPRD